MPNTAKSDTSLQLVNQPWNAMRTTANTMLNSGISGITIKTQDAGEAFKAMYATFHTPNIDAMSPKDEERFIKNKATELGCDEKKFAGYFQHAKDLKTKFQGQAPVAAYYDMANFASQHQGLSCTNVTDKIDLSKTTGVKNGLTGCSVNFLTNGFSGGTVSSCLKGILSDAQIPQTPSNTQAASAHSPHAPLAANTVLNTVLAQTPAAVEPSARTLG